MVKARVSYSKEKIGAPSPSRLLYMEIGRAKLGVAGCPAEETYNLVSEERYIELKDSMISLLGKTIEVDARKVVPVFLAAKHNRGLKKQVDAFFESLK